MLAIQNAVKRAFRVGVNRIVNRQIAARPVRTAPRVQVLAIQIHRLAITLTLDGLHVFHEIANLVKTVPGRKLYLRARTRARNANGTRTRCVSGAVKSTE